MRLLSRTALIVFAFCAIVAGSARAATDPSTTIKSFYATLQQTMQRGPQLGEAGRFNALAPAVRQAFDLPAMAQMAVGPSWATLTPAQREQVTQAFGRYTIATWADRFKKYGGERLEVVGEQKMPYGTLVNTYIVSSDGDQTAVNYLMRQSGGQWQVADIFLKGTISQIADLRSQFSSVISRGGAQELVNTLNRKTASLVPNAEAS
jgi:phospholipid transport system substrate-binding protein